MKAQIQRILWVDDGVEWLRLSTLPDRIAEAALGPAEGDDDAVFERGFRLPTERARAEQFIAEAIEQGRLRPISYLTGLPLTTHERWQHLEDAAASLKELSRILPEAWLEIRYRVRPDGAPALEPAARVPAAAPAGCASEGQPGRRAGRPPARWKSELDRHFDDWEREGKISVNDALIKLAGLQLPWLRRDFKRDGLEWDDDYGPNHVKRDSVSKALSELRKSRRG